MKSKTYEQQMAKLQKRLDEVNADIDNYFEGDNDEYFGDPYYTNLMNEKAELEERIHNL